MRYARILAIRKVNIGTCERSRHMICYHITNSIGTKASGACSTIQHQEDHPSATSDCARPRFSKADHTRTPSILLPLHVLYAREWSRGCFRTHRLSCHEPAREKYLTYRKFDSQPSTHLSRASQSQPETSCPLRNARKANTWLFIGFAVCDSKLHNSEWQW